MDLSVWDKPALNKNTTIGIVICITGNILISLALNIQKLAHHKVAEKKEQARSSVLQEEDTDITPRNERFDYLENIEERSERTNSQRYSRADEADPGDHADPSSQEPTGTSEQSPLLQFPSLATRSEPALADYGASATSSASNTPAHAVTKKKSFFSRVMGSNNNSLGRRAGLEAVTHASQPRTEVLPVDVVSSDAPPPARTSKGENKASESSPEDEGNESDYLKSKLWWTGFILMNVGETGNFISYAWAPASIVAPLGTFALIANCFFAPLILKERFRKRDLFGIALSIVGAVTVVLSSSSSSDGDPRLKPPQLIAAISRTPFIVYTILYVIGIAILATVSRTEAGKRFVFIDVGVCALFGGFTVLSTKAVSSLLTMEWIKIFTEWITYPVVAVLALTGIGQIRYLNRALMRFDSKVVIPIQFVLFNLSAIVGSSILYGDFENAKFHQIVTFLYGCAATFAGVFVITWASPNRPNHQSEPSSEELGSPLSEHHDPRSLAQRRDRATLYLPPNTALPGPSHPGESSASRSTPVLRHRQSGVSVRALSSPAQHLLLVHSPPRDISLYRYDVEHGLPESSPRRWSAWAGSVEDRHPVGSREGSQSRKTSLTRDYRERTGSVPWSVGRNGSSRSGVSLPRDWTRPDGTDESFGSAPNSPVSGSN